MHNLDHPLADATLIGAAPFTPWTSSLSTAWASADSSSFITAILVGMNDFIPILIYIALMDSEDKHLFLSLGNHFCVFIGEMSTQRSHFR